MKIWPSCEIFTENAVSTSHLKGQHENNVIKVTRPRKWHKQNSGSDRNKIWLKRCSNIIGLQLKPNNVGSHIRNGDDSCTCSISPFSAHLLIVLVQSWFLAVVLTRFVIKTTWVHVKSPLSVRSKFLAKCVGLIHHTSERTSITSSHALLNHWVIMTCTYLCYYHSLKALSKGVHELEVCALVALRPRPQNPHWCWILSQKRSRAHMLFTFVTSQLSMHGCS